MSKKITQIFLQLFGCIGENVKNNVEHSASPLIFDLQLQKQNQKVQVVMSHKTVVLGKLGHILQRKCPLVFPLISYDCCACLQLFIWQAVLNNYPVLQLQLKSAGSLDVAFRNLCESQR